jgi:hypothetical protein
MRKFILYLLTIFVLNFFNCVYAGTVVYSENNKFGLKDSKGNIITEAEYKKLVRLGESAWIVQDGARYGIMGDDGNFIVRPKFTHAERVLGKFVKFAKGDRYGIYDEKGFVILPVEYSSIDLLYGGLFVTCKDYKYGISDFNGQIILDNIFDDIYMPNVNKLVIIYGSEVAEIERKDGEKLEIPYDIQTIRNDLDITVSELSTNPLATTGYYSVTFLDYIMKLFAVISPSYEQTIDELMFSQGADTVSVLVKLSWIPKFPFVYSKRYYKNLVDPTSGPLNMVKKNLKYKIKEN